MLPLFSVIFSSIPKIYVARVQVDILKIDRRQLTVTSLGSYLWKIKYFLVTNIKLKFPNSHICVRLCANIRLPCESEHQRKSWAVERNGGKSRYLESNKGEVSRKSTADIRPGYVTCGPRDERNRGPLVQKAGKKEVLLKVLKYKTFPLFFSCGPSLNL